MIRRLQLLLLLWSQVGLAQAQVLITEVMYHPFSNSPDEQYIEIHNASPLAVDLNGWRFSGAIDLHLTNVTLQAHGFMVVVANRNRFQVQHPGVSNVVGNWSGILDRNSTVRLRNATNAVVTALTYSAEGDWSYRILERVQGYLSWEWSAPHDGGGSSLELVNLNLPIAAAQNWTSSTLTNGTPGTHNSVATLDTAPLISRVTHTPTLPGPTDIVTIVAQIHDEPTALPPSATLFWRVDASPTNSFNAEPLLDNGALGDGPAGDLIYGARIPAQPLGTLIEYYIAASDSTGHTRIYPANISTNARSANFVYQVDSPNPVSETNSKSPTYRVIMTQGEKAALDAASGAGLVNANSNGAFIVPDGKEFRIFQQVHFRNRGNGSRWRVPHNIKVNLPGDQDWENRSGINLNSAYPFVQMAGSAMLREIGLLMPESRLVHLRVNGVNLGVNAPSQYGYYAANWDLESELIRRQIPHNEGGNIYRGIRGRGGPYLANLDWLGTNAIAYTRAYFKANKSTENNWTDLIDLIAILNNANGYVASNYIDNVRRRLDVRLWMRYFASQTILANRETNLSIGYGDDYTLYSGVEDTRFQIMPHDQDTVFGQGDSGAGVTDDLFRMAIPGWGNSVPAVDRLIKTPEFVRIYYDELLTLCRGPFAASPMSDRLERLFRDTAVPLKVVAEMTNFNAARVTFILSNIPTNLTVRSNWTTKLGYAHATEPLISLSGLSHATRTHRVMVNGVPATWTAWQARWAAPEVRLLPGINRILIQSIGENDEEFERLTHEVWYESNSHLTPPDQISIDTTWSADARPYLIRNQFTINAGTTLTIEPGTTVFLAANASITVANGGRILANGQTNSPVKFVRVPGSDNWNGITINGGTHSPESEFHHVHFEGYGTQCLQVTDGAIWLDHATFGTTSHPYLSLDRASFYLNDCIFPTATASFELVHGTGGIRPGGRGVIERCLFGSPIGFNDAVDFTGGNRELNQPILHFFNNVFLGSDDDLVDLDGTDAWIEGNIFLHCHANGSPDSASAISGGSNSGYTSEITAINNIFFDCDQAATAKEGNYYALFNNTIVRMTRQGGIDTAAGVVNVRDNPTGGSPTALGKGFYLEGNLIADVETLVRNNDPVFAPVTFNNNILPQPWLGIGSNNIVSTNHLLIYLPSVDETRFKTWEEAQVLWDWFRLQPASPARRPPSVGGDIGAIRASPIRLIGWPAGPVTDSSLNIRLSPHLNDSAGFVNLGWPSGVGFLSYKFRLDGGPWSAGSLTASPLQLNNLSNGSHELELSVSLDSGISDPKIGLNSAATTLRVPFTIDSNYQIGTLAGLQFHEILAHNTSAFAVGTDYPDLVELYNSSNRELDLSGAGISSSPTEPFRYRFPAGSKLAPKSFRILLAEKSTPTTSPYSALGFSLARSGDALYLHSAATNLIDSIRFGAQLADLSLGRNLDRSWALGYPSFGNANTPMTLGNPQALRINEWLAAHQVRFQTDYIELYNTDTRPVDAGACYLSAAPGSPQQFQIPAYHFIAGRGLHLFVADGEAPKTDHLNFTLDPVAGFIGLSDPDFIPIDRLTYGPQTEDISEGRSPNGSRLVLSQNFPSPNANNSLPPPINPIGTNITTVAIPLVSFTNNWRYFQQSTPEPNWIDYNFRDSTWIIGSGLFFAETAALPEPKQTTLALGHLTHYFRTQFQLEDFPEGSRLLLSTLVDDGAMFWLNGQPIFRIGLKEGEISDATPANRTVGNAVMEGPFELPTDNLYLEHNVLAARLHQSTANSSDAVFGASLSLVYTVTNYIELTNTTSFPIVLNEIVADNRSTLEPDLSAPDWLEIYNPNTNAVALTGRSLTDDLKVGPRFSFPEGIILAANSFYRLRCDSSQSVSPSNTGFGLRRTGGFVYLLRSPEAGGTIEDAVSYGLQSRDVALARFPDGGSNWVPCHPSPNAPNKPIETAPAMAVRINEWVADSSSGDDWIELYNSGTAPVILDGYHLSDDPAAPLKYTFPPYSFLGVGLGAWVQLHAAGSLQPPNATYLNFKLNRSGDVIVYSDPAGLQLDAVRLGRQETDISEGRLPDGSGSIIRFPTLPTPGALNVADADRDRMADDWELLHNLKPNLASDAIEDFDQDGLSNRQEYIAGTDPHDASSHLQLNIATNKAGGITVRFRAPAERECLFQSTDSLNGEWQTQFDPKSAAFDRAFEIVEAQNTASTQPNPQGGSVTPASVQKYYRLIIRSTK